MGIPNFVLQSTNLIWSECWSENKKVLLSRKADRSNVLKRIACDNVKIIAKKEKWRKCGCEIINKVQSKNPLKITLL